MILLNQRNGLKTIDYYAVLLYYDVMEEKKLVIHSCGVTVCQDDWSWDTGKYPSPDYDLWTVLQGEGIIAAAGKEYPVSEGSCMMLRPGGQYIGRQNLKNRLSVLHLHFDAFSSDGSPVSLEDEFPLLRELYDFPFVRHLMFKMLDAWNGNGRAEAIHWLFVVLDEIRRQDRETEGGVQSSVRKQVQALCRRIQQDPGRRYRLKPLAEEYGYSPDYFGRLFSTIAGKPLSEYVIGVRINQAKLLLRDSEDTVEQISEQLGYGDVCFFCRQFKNIEGLSPGKYRLQFTAAKSPIKSNFVLDI